jgi:hypothetical protein
MKTWKMLAWTVSINMALAGYCQAQIPGAGGGASAAAVAAGVPGAAGAAGVGAAAGGGRNIWSWFLLTPEQKERCHRCWCDSGIGKMVASAMRPMGMYTGGLIGGGCCSCTRPTATELAKPADSADGAAARIKQDELEAKARREAVRYLGTVDCRYWPEAEEALINALRGDRNECVRFEAACALQRGCCCTPKIAEALSITIEGDNRDGRPAERSERVKSAAAAALSMCVFEQTHPVGVVPIEQKGKETGPQKEGDPNLRAEYYKKLVVSREKQVAQAQAVLKKNYPDAAKDPVEAAQASRRGSPGVIGLILNSAAPQRQETHTAPPVAASQPMTQPIQQTGALVRETAPIRDPNAPAFPNAASNKGVLYRIIPGLN